MFSLRLRRVQATQGDLTIFVSPSLGNLTSFRESGSLSIAILEVGKSLGATSFTASQVIYVSRNLVIMVVVKTMTTFSPLY